MAAPDAKLLTLSPRIPLDEIGLPEHHPSEMQQLITPYFFLNNLTGDGS